MVVLELPGVVANSIGCWTPLKSPRSLGVIGEFGQRRKGLKNQFEGDLISGSGFGGVLGIWYDTAVPASRKSWTARLISISLGERERRSRSLTD